MVALLAAGYRCPSSTVPGEYKSGNMKYIREFYACPRFGLLAVSSD